MEKIENEKRNLYFFNSFCNTLQGTEFNEFYKHRTTTEWAIVSLRRK
ncbi:hypothetical protein LEP1GSC047_4418 [Leptospira inadai serovar Lyme str. 10]|uniref:Uncharacterized protein n=1 Tax=Leptospira inadai serovar Lyme str. 10 TaxID=1049790 RepID=V6HK82_9LEPT|nr:hypothetical protein LEP1GSC047_4418 [Leptospira inadai serovar Lyme str. 10]